MYHFNILKYHLRVHNTYYVVHALLLEDKKL